MLYLLFPTLFPSMKIFKMKDLNTEALWMEFGEVTNSLEEKYDGSVYKYGKGIDSSETRRRFAVSFFSRNSGKAREH